MGCVPWVWFPIDVAVGHFGPFFARCGIFLLMSWWLFLTGLLAYAFAALGLVSTCVNRLTVSLGCLDGCDNTSGNRGNLTSDPSLNHWRSLCVHRLRLSSGIAQGRLLHRRSTNV